MGSLKSKLKNAVFDLPAPILRKVLVARRLKSHPNEIEECIEIFSPASLSDKQKDALSKCILADMHNHLITPDEYFLYDFADKTESEKDEYVGDMERELLCARIYNNTPSGLIFMDKMKTYDNFSPFFKRDIIGISSEEDFYDYDEFVKTHPEYMVKPAAASRGNGIRKEKSSETEEERLEDFVRILDSGKAVVEEIIDQSEEMSALHPESVNTVRFATFLKDGEPITLACFVKIGRGSSVVDNGGAGGFLAAVDEETGIITTPGRTEHGEIVEIHPDTGIHIEGYQLPDWENLRRLMYELPQVLPDQPYVGWDLAHSATKGWVLVEGNSGGQFVGPQISRKQGIRELINLTFGRL